MTDPGAEPAHEASPAPGRRRHPRRRCADHHPRSHDPPPDDVGGSGHLLPGSVGQEPPGSAHHRPGRNRRLDHAPGADRGRPDQHPDPVQPERHARPARTGLRVAAIGKHSGSAERLHLLLPRRHQGAGRAQRRPDRPERARPDLRPQGPGPAVRPDHRYGRRREVPPDALQPRLAGAARHSGRPHRPLPRLQERDPVVRRCARDVGRRPPGQDVPLLLPADRPGHVHVPLPLGGRRARPDGHDRSGLRPAEAQHVVAEVRVRDRRQRPEQARPTTRSS